MKNVNDKQTALGEKLGRLVDSGDFYDKNKISDKELIDLGVQVLDTFGKETIDESIPSEKLSTSELVGRGWQLIIAKEIKARIDNTPILLPLLKENFSKIIIGILVTLTFLALLKYLFF